MRINRGFIAFAAAALIGIAGYAGYRLNTNKVSTMSAEQIKQKIPFQTYCIGRLAIDLPAGGEIHWSQSQFGGVFVESEPVKSADLFEMQLRTREIALEKTPHKTKGKLLIASTPIDGEPKGKLFEFWERSQAEDGIRYEAYVFARNQSLKLIATDALDLEPRGTRKKWVEELLANLSLQPRSLPEAVGGACFSEVFVKDVSNVVEDVDAFITWEEKFPGLQVNIKTRGDEREARKQNEPGLLERMKEKSAAIAVLFPNSKMTRQRKRDVSGIWAAEEIGFVEKDKDGDPRYGFALEAPQPKAGLSTPSLDVELEAARPEYGKLTEDELIAVWDAFVDSIRPRPAGLKAP